MTFTDYLINGALVALVLLQIRGRRLSVKLLVLPLAIVGFVAINYLHGIPTAGDDVTLELVGATVGLALGAGCGLATRVYRGAGGAIMSKAGPLAACLWVAGVGARMAFGLYATNGGYGAIGRFSATHHITSSEAWVASLILMALLEVLSRVAIIGAKYWRLAQAAPVAGTPSARHATMGLRGRWS